MREIQQSCGLVWRSTADSIISLVGMGILHQQHFSAQYSELPFFPSHPHPHPPPSSSPSSVCESIEEQFTHPSSSFLHNAVSCRTASYSAIICSKWVFNPSELLLLTLCRLVVGQSARTMATLRELEQRLKVLE